MTQTLTPPRTHPPLSPAQSTPDAPPARKAPRARPSLSQRVSAVEDGYGVIFVGYERSGNEVWSVAKPEQLTPYTVVVTPDGLPVSCSCPAHQFPDKHLRAVRRSAYPQHSRGECPACASRGERGVLFARRQDKGAGGTLWSHECDLCDLRRVFR